jgi:hypothetical protein
MSGIYQKALVAVCSLLVACPPAWCCYVLPLACCSQKADKPAESDKPKCSHCCPDKSAAKPAKPAKTPQPTGKGPQCCCDRQPATPPDGTVQVPGPMAADIVADVPAVAAAVSAVGWSSDFPVAVLPSALHVLHCVWLC